MEHSEQAPGRLPIGEQEVAEALRTLQTYKRGRANLEQRIVEDELWWELRHWEVIRSRRGRPEQRGPEPTSAWLFNAILNKHADAMDSYPEPVVLPREPGDAAAAKTLNAVLPVALENCGFEQTYSDNWWEKLKHGTAAYGVFWNSARENGLGEVDIRRIDLLKLFWEPGITDLQDSRSLFLVELAEEQELEEQYPQLRGRLGGSAVDVKEYLYDDTVDTSGKTVVVDWYYKRRTPGGRTLLHYAKLVGSTLLFASENLPLYRDTGWYEDGLYPVVLDVLFPEKGTPAGFGYVALCKDPQLYIDKLSANILESSLLGTKKRFFVSESTSVNEAEFLDWNRPVVHVAGALDDAHLREIAVRPLDGVYVTVLQNKINEMKETAANRDMSAGGTASGVTAAAAITALQEAGNKVSRDMISASYRAYVAVNTLVLHRLSQFYDERRTFRILGELPGDCSFVEFDNRALRPRPVGLSSDGTPLVRRPVFDLKIRAQKRSPFARAEQNERAKELYRIGFFRPERAQEALAALELMEFEGVEQVRERVREGETLLNTCRALAAQTEQLTALVAALRGSASGGPSAGAGA